MNFSNVTKDQEEILKRILLLIESLFVTTSWLTDVNKILCKITWNLEEITWVAVAFYSVVILICTTEWLTVKHEIQHLDAQSYKEMCEIAMFFLSIK